jgi:hypothetical protein
MKTKWLLVVALFVLSCSNNPITGRKQLSLVSEEQMLAMSIDEYQQFLTLNRSKVISTGPDADMVKKIGNRISKSVTEYMTQVGLADRMKNYQWEFTLVKDSVANAWCIAHYDE